MPSRQRAWQLRQKEKGLCMLCNSPKVSASYCQKHLEAARTRGRNAKRVKVGIPIDAPINRTKRTLDQHRGPTGDIVVLLGTALDKDVAKQVGFSPTTIWRWRTDLRIPAFRKHNKS